jgi:hypothetical protein
MYDSNESYMYYAFLAPKFRMDAFCCTGLLTIKGIDTFNILEKQRCYRYSQNTYMVF